MLVEAGDVLATVCGNQANVALMQHRHEQALALAERSVELQEHGGTPHGLGVALASLGQICVRLGNLKRAEEALNRALDVRSPLHFMRETTGAVFDTLAQIHLIRGQHEEADRSLPKAREAYGEYGSQRPLVPVVGARAEARSRCGGRSRRGRGPRVRRRQSVDAPPGYALQAELIAIEALLASTRRGSAAAARGGLPARISPRHERHLGRVPAAARPAQRRPAARPRRITTSARASACSTCSASAIRPGLSYLELGRLAACRRRALAGDALPDRRGRDLRVAGRGAGL